MIYVKALLLIALLFLAITFGIQNSEAVVLRYYFGLASVPVPLYLVIYVAIILGILGGLAIDLYSRITLRSRLKKLEKANASLRQDLEKLESEAAGGAGSELQPRPAEVETGPVEALPSSTESQPENQPESSKDSKALESGKDR
ncbi:MAG: LapA family protein [Deltaproteobacteria bacterium]|nr:LapA family protein [Deltaproteobacteria bacterium]MBW2122305.1 LapA family protein [Deltaproteobacteria bacterium]